MRSTLIRICLLTICLAGALSSLQAQSWVTELSYGDPDYDDRAYDIKHVSDLGSISIGLTYGLVADPNGAKAYIVLTDELGGDIDEWVFDIDLNDYDMAVYVCENGDFVWTCAVNADETDILVARMETDGTIAWAQLIGVGNGAYDYATDIVENADGEIVVCGVSNDPASMGGYDAVVMALDGSSGSLNWSKLYGTQDDNSASAIINMEDGGYILAGESLVGVDRQAWAFRIDAAGDVKWSHQYGDPARPEFFTSLVANANGWIYAAGGSQSSFGTDIDAYLVSFQQDDGVATQQRLYAVRRADEFFTDVTVMPDSRDLFLVGFAVDGNDRNINDAFFSRIEDRPMDQVIRKTYGEQTVEDYGAAIAFAEAKPGDTDEGFWMAGWHHNNDRDNYWVARTNLMGKTGCGENNDPAFENAFDDAELAIDSDKYSTTEDYNLESETYATREVICPGQHVPVDQSKKSVQMPTETVKLTVGPNPLQRGQTLNISGAEWASDAVLTVSDLQGRVLIRQSLTSGSAAELQVPTQELAAGVYILRIASGIMVEAHSLMVRD